MFASDAKDLVSNTSGALLFAPIVQWFRMDVLETSDPGSTPGGGFILVNQTVN